MLVKDDGSVRYFTARESARLQTFADSFVFPGSWTETMRQLGNAVPVVLARRVAEQLLLYKMGRIAAADVPAKEIPDEHRNCGLQSAG